MTTQNSDVVVVTTTATKNTIDDPIVTNVSMHIATTNTINDSTVITKYQWDQPNSTWVLITTE